MFLPDDLQPVWLAHVSEEGLLEYADPEDLQAYVQSLKGRDVEMQLRPVSQRRSLRQSRWWWGWFITPLADHLGWDRHERDELHYALVMLCFGTTFNETLGVDVPTVRSSRLKTWQFSALMEWGVRYAAQTHQFVVQLPDELAMTTQEHQARQQDAADTKERTDNV